MRTLPRVRLLVASSCAAALLVAAPAAASEGQWHVGGGLGTAAFAGGGAARYAVDLHGAYELTDQFDLRLDLLSSRHLVDGAASLGLVYKLDVIEWVPYVGVGLGFYWLGDERRADLAQRELGLSVPLGIDYAPSRSFAVGLQLRYHGFFSELPTTLGGAALLDTLLRAEYRWGW